MNSMYSAKRTVGILIFDDVEVLDFAGPFEVFSVANQEAQDAAFNVLTISPAPGTVRTRGGLKINPHHTFEDCPSLDILVVPGGRGTRALLQRPAVLEWVHQRARRAEIVFSVCTGSLLLGQLGLLDGLTVTTHASCLDLLAQLAPTATIDASRRFHDHGHLITAAGISAGLDAALHLVGRLGGADAATATAREMEYGAHAQPLP